MRTYCISQGTLLSALWWPKTEGNPKRGDMCIHREKEMATHSSILACRIPWTEEPGGLQSMGSQRVGHDWCNLAAAAVGFPGGSGGKDCLAMQDPWVGKIPWRRKWHPTPGILPVEFHGQRSLAGCSPGGCEESGITEQLSLTQWAMDWFTYDRYIQHIHTF